MQIWSRLLYHGVYTRIHRKHLCNPGFLSGANPTSRDRLGIEANRNLETTCLQCVDPENSRMTKQNRREQSNDHSAPTSTHPANNSIPWLPLALPGNIIDAEARDKVSGPAVNFNCNLTSKDEKIALSPPQVRSDGMTWAALTCLPTAPELPGSRDSATVTFTRREMART